MWASEAGNARAIQVPTLPGGNGAMIGAAAQRANGAGDDADDLRVSAAVPSMGSKPVAGVAAGARPSRGCLVALRLFSQKEGSPSAMARGLLFPGLAGEDWLLSLHPRPGLRCRCTDLTGGDDES